MAQATLLSRTVRWSANLLDRREGVGWRMGRSVGRRLLRSVVAAAGPAPGVFTPTCSASSSTAGLITAAASAGSCSQHSKSACAFPTISTPPSSGPARPRPSLPGLQLLDLPVAAVPGLQDGSQRRGRTGLGSLRHSYRCSRAQDRAPLTPVRRAYSSRIRAAGEHPAVNIRPIIGLVIGVSGRPALTHKCRQSITDNRTHYGVWATGPSLPSASAGRSGDRDNQRG